MATMQKNKTTEERYSFERFKRFFMPVTDLDVDPPVTTYAGIDNAEACWKYFVEPLISQERKQWEEDLREKIKERFHDSNNGHIIRIINIQTNSYIKVKDILSLLESTPCEYAKNGNYCLTHTDSSTGCLKSKEEDDK